LWNNQGSCFRSQCEQSGMNCLSQTICEIVRLINVSGESMPTLHLSLSRSDQIHEMQYRLILARRSRLFVAEIFVPLTISISNCCLFSAIPPLDCLWPIYNSLCISDDLKRLLPHPFSTYQSARLEKWIVAAAVRTMNFEKFQGGDSVERVPTFSRRIEAGKQIVNMDFISTN
jgi:hypothetical protein